MWGLARGSGNNTLNLKPGVWQSIQRNTTIIFKGMMTSTNGPNA